MAVVVSFIAVILLAATIVSALSASSYLLPPVRVTQDDAAPTREDGDEVISHPRSVPLLRSLAGGWLPNHRSLLEASFREIESLTDKFRLELGRVGLLVPGLTLDQSEVDRLRQLLFDISLRYLEQQAQLTERLSVRHHSEGNFGRLAAGAIIALELQAEQIRADNQHLNELAAEPDTTKKREAALAALSRLLETEARLKESLVIARSLAANRRSLAASAAWNSFEPVDTNEVRQCLARVLTRWWETRPEPPGSLTIALVHPQYLVDECPDLELSEATRLLYSAARLILNAGHASGGAPGNKGCDALSLVTEVVSRSGLPRTIAWSCTVACAADSRPESIIASGLIRDAEESPVDRAAPSSMIAAPPAREPVSQVESERRRKPRLPFQVVQLLAPLVEEGMPPLTAFYEVRCQDISENGFSFLSPTIPTTSEVIVALGTDEPHLYMKARLVHFTRQEREGSLMYLVGCQFVGRAPLLMGGQGWTSSHGA